MDYIRKMVKSLIAGYVITLLMLGLLTYFMRKFILDEKAVDNIIFGIYQHIIRLVVIYRLAQ